MRFMTLGARTALFGAAMLLFGLSSAIASTSAQAGTLEDIRDRGYLQCGVAAAGIGLSEIDDMGVWQGFFPDFCRLLAVAVLSDSEAVEFIEINNVNRFEALNSGAFDILMANTTWTTTRDAEYDLAFTNPIYYDGQGLLAHASLGASSLEDLEGRPGLSVCVSEGTTTIRNLREVNEALGLEFEIITFHSIEGLYHSFFGYQCDLMTYDRLALVSQLMNRAADPAEFVLFSDIISKEPLAPVVRQADQDWVDAVQWTVYASMIAEEYGITSENVADQTDPESPELRRLLGIDPGMGETLGLPETWAQDGIAQVGNYGEIFGRNLGAGSTLGLERGLNALWTEGGLLYAPPLR